MGYICGAKDSFIETIFVECVRHLKESLENKRKRKLVKEAEVNAAISTLRRSQKHREGSLAPDAFGPG